MKTNSRLSVSPMTKIKVADGQVPLFFEEQEPEPYVPPGEVREEVPLRAGTKLNHKWTHKIRGSGHRKSLVHGLYDESQRIYQSGGELSRFAFWKRRWITISEEAWRQIYQKVDWIEIIDHERNECWRIAMKKALKEAVPYDAGLGPRIGIPMEDWTVIDANGEIKRR